jgi:hypothetical protein
LQKTTPKGLFSLDAKLKSREPGRRGAERKIARGPRFLCAELALSIE